MMKKTILCAWALLTTGVALADGGVAPAAADTSRVVDLDEVVIVKELFPLRRQPLSSTVLGSGDITRLRLHDLREASQYVPSFVMPPYGSRYTSAMYVRGIGSRVNSPAVGIYVDNIPVLNKSMFNAHTYQTERIDVMRGPQGTLYGQNTEGGLIRIYSRSPLSHQGTDVSLSFGTGLSRQVEAAHYALLGEGLGLSVAAFYDGQQGFFDNTTTGSHADESNEAGGKIRLQWKATERLLVDVTGDYQWVRQNGFPYGQIDTLSGRTDPPASNRQGEYRRHMLTTGLNLSYQGERADVSYTASWQYLNDRMLMDIDYRPQDYMHMQQKQLQNALTQELAIRNRTTGPWHWTTGTALSYQALKTDAPVFFDSEMNDFLSQTIENYAYQGMLRTMSASMGTDAAAAMIERMGGCHIRMDMETVPGLFRTPQTNWGVYHESSIDIGPRLTATLGLRYDLSHTSIDYLTQGAMHLDEHVRGTAVTADVLSVLQHKESETFGQLLPKVGLRYRIDHSGSNVYALVAKGYRAGGFNIQMFSDILQTELQNVAQTARGNMDIAHDDAAYDNIRQTIAYKPEESWNYEAGAHLNLFGGSVQADLAAYYMQIRNQQLSVMAGSYGFGRMMVNAGRSYSCGIEATLRGRALDNRLAWTLSYGYTHAAFKEYRDSTTAGTETVAVDYKGRRVPFVPEHTLAAHADYRIDMGATALRALTFGTSVTAQGKTYWDEANRHAQNFYALLGANVDADFGGFTLSLWGRNLTGTRYNTFVVDSPMAGTTNYYANLGQPRQVGIDLRMHF